MATSNGRSVGRPPYTHSQIRDGDYEPGDEMVGGWSLQQLHDMNDRFVERMNRAIALGLEAPPQGAPQQDAPPTQIHNGSACAHCGRPFFTTRSDKKFCSQWCCQAAYRVRKRSGKHNPALAEDQAA